MKSVCMLALGALWSVAGSAVAQTPNSLLDTLGPLSVQEVRVAVVDGVIPQVTDGQALAYVERRMTPDEKARFTTAMAERVFDRRTSGERLAEYLIQGNTHDRLAASDVEGREVVLTLRVDGADFPVMRIPLAPPLPIKTSKASLSFEVIDAQTNALLARGRIDDAHGLIADTAEARTRGNLRYQNFGRDDHLQVLAGVTNALSRNVEALIRDTERSGRYIQGERMTIGTSLPVTIVEGAPAAKITIDVSASAD